MFFPTPHFALYGFIWLSFDICVLFCFENKFCEAMNNCVDINHRIRGGLMEIVLYDHSV